MVDSAFVKVGEWGWHEVDSILSGKGYNEKISSEVVIELRERFSY